MPSIKEEDPGPHAVNNVQNMKAHLSFLLLVTQAEAWIKSKLRDLKDGGNVQRRPLQDWEEAPQTLHAALKDFEDTIVQLNQVRRRFSSRPSENRRQSEHDATQPSFAMKCLLLRR